MLKQFRWYPPQFIILLIFLMLIYPARVMASAVTSEELHLSAEAALLIDAQNGRVLYSRNAAKQLPPASTTKIVTALLGLELREQQELITVSKGAASTPGTSLNLRQRDRFRLGELIKGALINSGNDSAVAIAEVVGGNISSFAALMDFKCQTLGAIMSHFLNPHGLTRQGHLVTAYDLAMVSRYALTNATFRQIVRTRSALIYEADKGFPVALYNTNRLLENNSREQLQFIGIKTGTTNAAGQCLVAAAESQGRVLISVVLHSYNRYGDTRCLFDYALHTCRWLKVADSHQPFMTLPLSRHLVTNLEIYPESDLTVILPPEQLPLLEKRVLFSSSLINPLPGNRIGQLKVYLGDQLLDSTYLRVGQKSVRKALVIKEFTTMEAKQDKSKQSSD